MIKAPFSLLFH